VSELPSSEDLDPSTGTDAPTPPTTTGPSSYTLNWEEPVKDDDNVIDGWVLDYTIANGGDYPIENVVLLVIDTSAEDIRPEDQVGTCLELVLGTMHHKQVLTDKYGPLRIEHAPAFGEITAWAQYCSPIHGVSRGGEALAS
jgi:hypothetical protein